ncbi:uncharacterized protein LOC110029070 [Phalaenopsis equestris]|uniref:uncharacterized protein LOC110029070 n=1 Tax=Phalaenopsis equestris TaxID=78828 RepID=UPI0009E63468|nr:uncharacterized protein LOC110029070 [Phalaenopsis equestris]
MAVSFLQEPHCGFENTAIITNSAHSPVASKANKIVEVDDEKQRNECKHFTIRGYVAEVRKRDINNCWPFLLHNYASLETANVCPPLPVAKFRWWGCQNCVCDVIASTAQMATDGAMSVQNEDEKSNNNSLLGKATERSQLDARKVSSKLPQISKENNLKEILKINDCFVNISRVGKEENECLQRYPMEEGHKGDQDSQNEIQIVVSKANCVSNGRIAPNKRKREYRNSVGRKKLGVAYLKNVLSTALIKHKETKLNKIGHSKLLGGDATSIRFKFTLQRSEEYKAPKRRRVEKRTKNDFMKGHTKVDMVVGKNDVVDADPAHTLCCGACCQDKRICGASVDGSKYMGVTDDKHQIENEVENKHNKKARKVRFLEDIIRSETQHTIGNTLDRDAKTIQHAFIRGHITSEEKVLLNHANDSADQNNASKSVRGKSKLQSSLDEYEYECDSVTHMDRINHCAHQRNQLKSVKRKDKHEDFYDEDDGPLLMHWLKKKIPKKANAYEIDAHTNHFNGNFLPSNFSADLSGSKDRGVDVRDSVVSLQKQKYAFNQKQTLSPKDGQVASTILIREEMMSENFSSQDISKKNTVIMEKTQNFGKKSPLGEGENSILHSIINKKPRNDRIEFCRTKDSSSTQNKASFKVWEKASKKPQNMQSTDQEALDDFPMDIVELLARNQHDRDHHLAETDATNKLMFPTITGNINYSFGLDSSQLNRQKLSDAEQGNLSWQTFQVNNQGFDVRTTFPCNGGIDQEPKACHCSINGKKMLQIDLNQCYSDSLITRAASGNLDINSNGHQPIFSCCRSNNLKSSQSIIENQTVACENLSRNLHYEVIQRRNGTSFGVDSYFLNNLNGSVHGRDLKMFPPSCDYEMPRNPIGKQHHWGFSRTAPNASSFMELANHSHSNFCPADLYSNETISALNLLRLMDQSARSGEPRHPYRSYSGFTKEDTCFNGQYNDSQLTYGSQGKELGLHPLEVNPNPCQPRNSCLPLRPLPRIGILGPSLQKEIFNMSKDGRIPTKSSQVFLNANVNEKIKTSCLNPNTSTWNSCNSLFRCKCSAKIGPDRDFDRFSTSNTRFSLVRDGTTRGELNNKVDAILPLGFCKMEICVVNRNPADFTVLDETNEYMIETKELKLKSVPPSDNLRGSVHGQKKQRVMKLNDLKAFAMG